MLDRPSEQPGFEQTTETKARARWEQLTGGTRDIRFNTATGAISGALAGASAGPPGIIVGAALGALAGLWRGKAYREMAYAEMDAMGVLRKTRTSFRSIRYMQPDDFVFIRLPYANLTAYVIAPLLQEAYPDMSKMEIANTARASQRTLIDFHEKYPDVPITLAADIVLAYYNIIRDESGEYAVIEGDKKEYIPPIHEHIYIPPPDDREPHTHSDLEKKPNYALYGAIILALFLVLRE